MKISKEEFISLYNTVFTNKVIEELNNMAEENEYLEYLYALIQEKDSDNPHPKISQLLEALNEINHENQQLKVKLCKVSIIESKPEEKVSTIRVIFTTLIMLASLVGLAHLYDYFIR